MKKVALLHVLIIYFTHYSYSQQCRIKQFRCTDGSCLEGVKVCNTIEDCPSGEDENGNENYGCTKQTLASNCGSDFACRFGGCVPRSKLCDSVPDCWGGTDEATEICSRRPGYKPTLPSPGPSVPAATIKLYTRPLGDWTTTRQPLSTSPTAQSSNGSNSHRCHLREFRCSDGTCLQHGKICNAIEDCPSGEDENGNGNQDCAQITLGSNCRSDELKCRFGGCVLKTKLCDTVPDCWGGTDETIELCSR